MGSGMGLTMSPMSTAAMNAVDVKGRRRLRRAVDEPDGRRDVRRRRDGRDRHDGREVEARVEPSRVCRRATRASIANALGSGAAPTGHMRPRRSSLSSRSAFVQRARDRPHDRRRRRPDRRRRGLHARPADERPPRSDRERSRRPRASRRSSIAGRVGAGPHGAGPCTGRRAPRRMLNGSCSSRLL